MKTDAPAQAGDFQAAKSTSGLDVFVLPTRKFKTKLVRVHLRAALSGENAARALVPNLLRRGTRTLPTMVDVARALEGLYGTLWSSAVYKLGDEQVLSFRLETVEERFLPGRPRLFEPALSIAHQLIFEPRLVAGGGDAPGERFPDDVFAQEKLNHQREIEAQYDDKLTFAFQRLLEEMFPGEPYGRPVLGTREEAARLAPDDAVRVWRGLVQTLPARIFAVGDFTMAEAIRFVDEQMPLLGRKPEAAPTRPRPVAAAPREVTEKESISQSKLVSGRMVDLANLGEREYDALRVYAGVLGGGFHSRLFQTVREKHSLAYYASSSLDRLRGVLFTSCGIDAADRAKVNELVESEIASLRAQPPRDDELDQTRRLIVAGTRSTRDSPGGMVETFEAGLAAGRPRSLDQICRSVAAVTAADVQAVARRVGPPTVTYCLEGESQHEGEDGNGGKDGKE
jgi:predicted Zn-dependent peptidase